MAFTSKWSVLSIACALVGNGAAASAAQNPQGLMLRSTHGVVVGMQRGGGQATLRVMTRHANRNVVGAVNPAAGAASSVRAFTITPQTQFQAVQGINRMPASMAALRPGQRVIVQAQGQMAIGVQIIGSSSYSHGMRRAHPGGTHNAARISGSRRATFVPVTVAGFTPTGQPTAALAHRKTHGTHAAHVSTAKRK